MSPKPFINRLALTIYGLVRNWLFQRFFSLDPTMRTIKWAAEALLIIFMIYVFISVTHMPLTVVTAVVMVFVHTVFWLLFCPVWYPIICVGKLVGNDIPYILSYVEDIQHRVRNPFIFCSALSGSISKGQTSAYSDIDILIVRKPGLVNAFCSLGLVIRETLRAQRAHIALELLWSTNPGLIGNTSTRIVLYDPEGLSATKI